MNAADKFNQSKFGVWINGKFGRVFRLAAGVVFLVIGIIFIEHPLGTASLIWSFFPLSAGLFDICWISLVLGGSFTGHKIRARQADVK